MNKIKTYNQFNEELTTNYAYHTSNPIFRDFVSEDWIDTKV